MYFIIEWMNRLGVVGDVLSLVVIGPAVTLFIIWVMRFLHTETRMAIDQIIAGAYRRFMQLKTQ